MNMLRADLFRMSRVARMHGYLWKWMIGLFIGMALMNGVLSVMPGVMSDQAATANISEEQLHSAQLSLQMYDAAPSAFFATFLISPHQGSGLLVMLVCISVVVMFLADMKHGYASAITASTRGRLAFVLEQIVLAGVWTGALMLIMMVFSMLTMLPFGHMPHFNESVGGFALWVLGAWLCSWALSAASLAVACITRSMVISLGASLLFAAGAIPRLVSAVAALLSMIAPDQPPWSSWLGDVTALFPSACLDLLNAGTASLTRPAVGVLAGLPGGVAAQTLLLGSGWIILSAIVTATASRRRAI